MSHYRGEDPCIYFNKKYIGLEHHEVKRSEQIYLYRGGKGIEGCICHLNNINAVCGNILLPTHHLVVQNGGNPGIFTEPVEEIPKRKSYTKPQGLQELLTQQNSQMITFEHHITNIETRLDKIESILQKLEHLDLSSLSQILTHVMNIDSKT